MTPFQEFRLWARRAPVGERLAASVAAVVVMAVLAWILVPAGTTTEKLSAFPTSDTTGAATGGSATGGSTGATGTSGTATGTTTGTAPTRVGTTGTTGGTGGATSGATGTVGGATGSSSGTTTGGGKVCPKGSGKGLTATRMKVAVLLVEIVGPAANTTFGISTPEEQKKYYDAAIDEQNARGGVACRQLVPQYFKGNPAEQNGLGKLCLDVDAAGVFAVLDAGVYAQFAIVDCFAKHKIPYFGAYLLAQDQQQANYPWLFDFNLLDTLYHDAILGLNQRGFFSTANGFSKLGFIYRSCDKPMVNNFNRSLAKIGLPLSKIVTFDVGCPAALTYPNTLQQAVLKFQQEKVTHVTTASFIGDFGNFTKIAQQQGFKPKYGLADDSLVPLTYGSQAPDYDNIANAVAISASRDGEEKTAGVKPTAGTLRCDAAFKKKGIASTWSQPAGGGNACDNVWMFAAAADHAPALRGDALAAGLQAAGSVEFSYPQGPNLFTKPGTTFAGQYWRPLQFYRACSCWKLLDRNFKKTFS